MLFSSAESAAEYLLDAVEQLAEFGWDEDRIRAEFENAIEVTRDEGALES